MAAETSLNLQCARYMICIEQWYNPQRMNQIMGRIKRSHSKYESVVVICLYTRGTIEERIYNIMKGKEELFATVFGKEEFIYKLTADSLQDLLLGNKLDYLDYERFDDSGSIERIELK
jgi:SNF2 family DNA or RNA helicase